MARAHDEFRSLRFGRRESERVIVTVLLSALLHLAIWGGYHAGAKRGWWEKWHLPAWAHLGPTKKFALTAQMAHQQQPDIFVDVSHADADAPKETKFYSNKNSRAANPEVANTPIPKINGHQTDVPKTEDVPKATPSASPMPPPPKPTLAQAEPSPAAAAAKNEAAPTEIAKATPAAPNLQPSMPPPSPKPVPDERPETPQTPGETDLPHPKPVVAAAAAAAASQPQPARPRTLKQAMAQREQLPGRQMQQDGGVARPALWSSLDIKNTPFGDYDRAIIEAVQQRWYDLLDQRRFAQDRNGKVMLHFKLKPDGTIIEMQTAENNVGDLLGYLCQEAVEEAAPFAKWPPDMARMIGTNYREITFTFYYY